ncbi:MAG: hypothetical protein DSY70_05395, partial [Desulfobulbus sp.]
MRKLLNEISVIPGVSGSCIFDKKDGPLCKDLHPSLSEDLLHTVGIHLVRLLQMSSMSSLQVKSIHFRYDKYALVGMPLDTGVVLMTICEAHANCSLVATTASMLAADMREDLSRGINKPDIEAVTPDSEFVQEDDLELQLMYTEIEGVLAASVGPIAGMIMQDNLDKWRAAGPEIST